MPTYPLLHFFQEAIMIVWTSREWTWSWIENNIKSVLIDDHQINPATYGIDMEDPLLLDLENELSNHVEVPETLQPVDKNAWLELEETIDRNRPSAYQGVDIYARFFSS
ncbi:Hypothetical predicted protein [Paramuricea clavata]|uniref:Uncharacterized protein n=1 Tax=Paramuricea clavata TaxID=317549 RepID=A0A7D9LME4_PARCT|nr:Hypothetical predicted protein [Paramuricea clavata]